MEGVVFLCVGVAITLLLPNVYGAVENEREEHQSLGADEDKQATRPKEQVNDDHQELLGGLDGLALRQEDLRRQLKWVHDMTLAEQELRAHLLRGYDDHTRPRPTTVVNFRISLKHFDMVESEQSLMVDSWIVNDWNDPRLRWRPRDFHNISNLFFPYDSLWTPDFDVYNSARAGEGMKKGNVLLVVFSDGRVLYTPAVRLHFSCVLDLTFWPHDTHNCTVTIGSWVHDGFAIDPQLMDEKPELDALTRVGNDGSNLTRGSWDLLDANLTRYEKNYSCCPAPYVTIEISLLLARNAPAYTWTIKLPAIGLSLLTFVVFLLPPGAGEKLIFGGLCLILDVLFIAYTSHIVNLAPSHTPLIVELVSKQLMLIIASLIVVAVSTRLARVPHTSGLPLFIKKPLLLLSTCLCLQNYRNLVSKTEQPYTRTMKTDEVELGENGTAHMYHGDVTTSCGLDWILLAAFIDRVCLIIFMAIFIINMLAFRSVL